MQRDNASRVEEYMKDIIFKKIDKIKTEIARLSKDIHDNPELGFEEYKTVGFIKAMLSKHGFAIEERLGGLDTAFKARFKGKSGGVAVAFLAEFDALPGMGHACGHNLIAAISTGAAVGLSKVMSELDGEIVLLGTPAEEGGGGKIKLLEKGGFDDLDYALMTHPHMANFINRSSLAATRMEITYTGRSTHASTPEKGINALQAVIQTFNLIDSMRDKMPLKSQVSGIISNGGVTPGIIPDLAQCRFSVRSATYPDLKIVVDMVKTVVKSVECFTGATGTITTEFVYAERYQNHVISELYKKYMEQQGEIVIYPHANTKFGSSDIGNVSLKIPTVETQVKIVDEPIDLHTKEFAVASASDRALVGVIKAAKALGCAGYEILTDENLRREIKKEFDEKVPSYTNLNLDT